MTDPPTHQPTNLPHDPLFLKYYQLRVTVPHTDLGKLQEVFNAYSRSYCIALHVADDEVPHEHVHCLFLDLEVPGVEKLRKKMKSEFTRQGNGFLSGHFTHGHIYRYFQYVKHDSHVTYRFRGTGWQDHIANSPEYEQNDKKKKSGQSKRSREADPMLTYSNVLWRARAHRTEHHIRSTDLGVTLEHMTRTTNWIPSVELMRRGLDPLHHKLFAYQTEGKVGKTPDWWTPRIDAFKRD